MLAHSLVDDLRSGKLMDNPYTISNGDVVGPGGAIPGDIAPGSVYGFAPILPATLAGLRVQADAMAVGARPVHAHAAVPAPSAPLPPAPPHGAVVAGVPHWARNPGQIKRGDVLAVDPARLPPGHVQAGVQALVPSGADYIAAKKVFAEEAVAHRLDDIRILPVQFDAQGVRRREFNLTVSMLQDVVPQGGGLQLHGPPTLMNIIKLLRNQNLTPTIPQVLGSHGRSGTGRPIGF